MIDWTRARELYGEIGADDFDEVAELFLAEVEEALAQLLPTCTASTIEALLHAIKGAALNLGFSDLADLCEKGEKSAAKGDGQAVSLEAIKGCYQSSLVIFQDGRKRLSAA